MLSAVRMSCVISRATKLSVRSCVQAGSQTQRVPHILVRIVSPTTTLHLVTRLRIRIYLISSPHTLSQWDGCLTAGTTVLTRHSINPLKPELNPICYLLALLAHHFLHVSRIRVKSLTLRWLMSYIYGAPILDVSRSHTTTQHSR